MFRIEWLQSALDQMNNIWAKADRSQRDAIYAAITIAELRLSRFPENQGESRTGRLRILIYGPLSITFQVNADERVVLIADIVHRKPRGK